MVLGHGSRCCGQSCYPRHQGTQPEVQRPDHQLLPELDCGEAQSTPVRCLPKQTGEYFCSSHVSAATVCFNLFRPSFSFIEGRHPLYVGTSQCLTCQMTMNHPKNGNNYTGLDLSSAEAGVESLDSLSLNVLHCM